MKASFVIVLLFMLGLPARSFAQYDSEYQMRRYGGVDRSLTGQQEQQYRKKKQEPLNKTEMLDRSVANLNRALSLDTFQAAVVKQLIEENSKKEEQIVSQNIPDESKTEQIFELRTRLHGKIKEVLTADQREKFENLSKKKKR